jgi:hypothetical protein
MPSSPGSRVTVRKTAAFSCRSRMVSVWCFSRRVSSLARNADRISVFAHGTASASNTARASFGSDQAVVAISFACS